MSTKSGTEFTADLHQLMAFVLEKEVKINLRVGARTDSPYLKLADQAGQQLQPDFRTKIHIEARSAFTVRIKNFHQSPFQPHPSAISQEIDE